MPAQGGKAHVKAISFSLSDFRPLRRAHSKAKKRQVAIDIVSRKLANTSYLNHDMDTKIDTLTKTLNDLRGFYCDEDRAVMVTLAFLPLAFVIPIITKNISGDGEASARLMLTLLFLGLPCLGVFLATTVYKIPNELKDPISEVIAEQIRNYKTHIRDTLEAREVEICNALEAARADTLIKFSKLTKQSSFNSEVLELYKRSLAHEIKSYIDKVTAISALKGTQSLEALLKSAGQSARLLWESSRISAISCPGFSEVHRVLSRERSNLQGLNVQWWSNGHFVQLYNHISILYFALGRNGGEPTSADMQQIANEIAAFKPSLSVRGDYNDNSVRIDRSVSNVTNVQHAVIENGDYSDERVVKEILSLILKSPSESASLIELLAAIPVEEERMLNALERLQLSQRLSISNRPNGEICYLLDRLG